MQSITQSAPQDNPDFTGVIGVGLGMYESYKAGVFLQTLFSDSYQAALEEFHQILEDLRTIPLFVNGKRQDLETVVCQDCGRWNDLSEVCDHAPPMLGAR